MKLETLSRTKLLVAALSLFIVAAMGRLSAQTNSISEITNNKYALQNLLDGIQSDNNGVKRTSIYYVGKYRIKEAGSVLLNQLLHESNPSNRILIALVLYELGSEEGLLEIKKLAKSDTDENVRRMSTHIYYEYISYDKDRDLAYNN
jgi:HEAT repeat protein